MPNTKIFRGTNPCLLASEEVQGIGPHWMPVMVVRDSTANHPGAAPHLDVVSVCVWHWGKVLPVLILKDSGDVVPGWDRDWRRRAGEDWGGEKEGAVLWPGHSLRRRRE